MSQQDWKYVLIINMGKPELNQRMTEDEFRKAINLESPLPLELCLQQPRFVQFDAQLRAQGIDRRILVPLAMPRMLEGCLN